MYIASATYMYLMALVHEKWHVTYGKFLKKVHCCNLFNHLTKWSFLSFKHRTWIYFDNVEEQHDDVMKNVKAIRSDFLLKIDQKKMEDGFRDRDFESIKAAFRDIVNEHVEHPVDTIYFESILGYW